MRRQFQRKLKSKLNLLSVEIVSITFKVMTVISYLITVDISMDSLCFGTGFMVMDASIKQKMKKIFITTWQIPVILEKSQMCNFIQMYNIVNPNIIMVGRLR